MTRVHDVRLELVRPGPPHNQLLSPLTPYMALCGEASPITFHIDFEHRQLLNRLERLRYVSRNADGVFVSIPERLREGQVHELGEEIGRLLGRITSLNTELARARSYEGHESEFVHLRLVLSGSELAILPFELARAPQAFPGEGLDLCLQGNLPIVITREVRRSRPLPARWGDRDPKILFVYAEPEGLSVPKREHVRALRAALDPWIAWPDESAKPTAEHPRLTPVKDRLRVVCDASVEAIYNMCAAESFTHVHILAHGDSYSEAGEERFGVALHRADNPSLKQVVGGRQLAQAIRAEGAHGCNRSEPLIVTLAICDSGQQGSVLVPGGSIAHDLHTEGIPWVFASQFPLTKKGSVLIVDFLYPRLLRGDDPRQVLYELRRTLSMRASGEHDWASLVTYASLDQNLEKDVATFFEKQTLKAIEVQMARADRLVATMNAHSGPDSASAAAAALDHDTAEGHSSISDIVEHTLETVKTLLKRWEMRIPMSSVRDLRDRTSRTNCFGMQGSTLKRIGLLQGALGNHDRAEKELRDALEAYRKAMDEWVTEDARFNWTASQYLALTAVLNGSRDDRQSNAIGPADRGTYAVCRRLAQRDLDSPEPSIRAWAHGTLAELELLGSVYAETGLPETVRAHCAKVIDLMGPQSFHVASTRRQFQRYVDGWLLRDWAHPEWATIAQSALKGLEAGSTAPAPQE